MRFSCTGASREASTIAPGTPPGSRGDPGSRRLAAGSPIGRSAEDGEETVDHRETPATRGRRKTGFGVGCGGKESRREQRCSPDPAWASGMPCDEDHYMM
ncbi:hypothetical protein Maq22A_c05425 [Methylobacterium aquaticum]|uniref:Uncharacterized protein n=1 Tax=Methylobacterium aquaticum TaxID=270351 RepID=A0A0C6FHB0_9HYPH|nr:hypothetical protein Maq22A_c05425 [Methylobacterium aquaticum]